MSIILRQAQLISQSGCGTCEPGCAVECSVATLEQCILWRFRHVDSKSFNPLFQAQQLTSWYGCHRYIASAGDGSDIIVWDLSAGKIAATLPSESKVWSLDFSAVICRYTAHAKG